MKTDLEGLARKLAACLSAHGEADWRRFVLLAEDIAGAQRGPDCYPIDGPGVDAGAPPVAPSPDDAFLHRILLGLTAAAIISGGITAALSMQMPVAG